MITAQRKRSICSRSVLKLRHMATLVGSVLLLGSFLTPSCTWSQPRGADDKPEVSTFVVDGISYTQELYGEDKAREVPYIVVTRAGLENKTVFGFSTEKALEEWLADNCSLQEYQHLKKLRGRAMRPLTPPEEARLHQLQMSEVKKAIARFSEALQRHGVPPDDRDRVAQLIADYDPLLGAPGSTVYPFADRRYVGSHLVLMNGWTYPNFAWLGFDNTSSSIIVSGSATLYDQINFGGRTLLLFSASISSLAAWPYVFDNRISSAVVR